MPETVHFFAYHTAVWFITLLPMMLMVISITLWGASIRSVQRGLQQSPTFLQTLSILAMPFLTQAGWIAFLLGALHMQSLVYLVYTPLSPYLVEQNLGALNHHAVNFFLIGLAAPLDPVFWDGLLQGGLVSQLLRSKLLVDSTRGWHLIFLLYAWSVQWALVAFIGCIYYSFLRMVVQLVKSSFHRVART